MYTMEIINGKEIAQNIVRDLKERQKPSTFLAVFYVGDHHASALFIAQKERVAKELGVDFKIQRLPAESSTADVCAAVALSGKDPLCGGIVVQLPLPNHIDAHMVLNTIPFEKDIEALSDRAMGAFYNHKLSFLPPAVGAIDAILRHRGISRESIVSVATVGQGLLVGRPATAWFAGVTPIVYAIDKGSDLKLLAQADLVVCGTGSPRIISASLLKPGAGVIDFGYFVDNESHRICGDFDPLGSESLAFYTPTPGGTGPILVASLFLNFFSGRAL